MKIKLDGQSQEQIEDSLQELYKSFALLPEEEQKFAKVFINDVKLGNIIPISEKTFIDYIVEYMQAAKNDQIHRFAMAFCIDEQNLREIMDLDVSEENINEFGRLDNLKSTADLQKIKTYFEEETGETLSIFRAKSKFDNLLRQFVLSGGFDL